MSVEMLCIQRDDVMHPQCMSDKDAVRMRDLLDKFPNRSSMLSNISTSLVTSLLNPLGVGVQGLGRQQAHQTIAPGKGELWSRISA